MAASMPQKRNITFIRVTIKHIPIITVEINITSPQSDHKYFSAVIYQYQKDSINIKTASSKAPCQLTNFLPPSHCQHLYTSVSNYVNVLSVYNKW